MIRIGLLGTGRIGATHLKAVESVDGARISVICDPHNPAALDFAKGANADLLSYDDFLGSKNIDAAIIASPTGLHATQIRDLCQRHIPIFCEKPIALSLKETRECLAFVQQYSGRLMIGFQRRFDPHFAELKQAVRNGEIGQLEMLHIISRDPAPAPIEYLKTSGGLFKDMMIHDFDMARFVTGEEITSVSAMGESLIDPAIGDAGDIDSATALLRSTSGRLISISNSRRANYGYDQRVEAHGSLGMIRADNLRESSVVRATEHGFLKHPSMHFFMERYKVAYAREISYFISSIEADSEFSPSGHDGLASLEIAQAAELSRREAREVTISEIKSSTH